MEQTFYEFGVLCLRWTDKNGNVWEAVKEQVDLLGKECFEQDPYENLTDEDFHESTRIDFSFDF